jgi:putative Ca2+/H+ antiporter (TMEM165/GDT1 family)
MPATTYFAVQEAVMPQRWRGQAVAGFVLPVGGDWAPLMANVLMTVGVGVLFARRMPMPLAMPAAALLGAALALVMFVPPFRLM